MLIDQREVERVLAAPDRFVAILLFGPDAGLVRERADALVRRHAGAVDDPFRVSDLPPALWTTMADELASVPLTGGGRVVRVRDATDALAAPLAEALKRASQGAMAVLEAGDLAPRSRLRSLAQQAERAAAIGCYAEDGRALERRLRDALAKEGITAQPDALALLAERLPADRGVVRQELEKLILLAGPRGEVTAELASRSAAANADDAADEAIEAALMGDGERADALLDQTLSSGTAAVAIIRAALRQAMRLHEMRCAVGKGAADAAAMIQGWRPPVHFRSRKAVAQALALWSESGLAETITILLDAEVALKTGRPDLAVCRRAIQGLGRPR